MEREEKILKLMNKTGASRQDVEKAMNACNDDILDAAMYLDALGKVNPMAGFGSTEGSSTDGNCGGTGFTSCGSGNAAAGYANSNQNKGNSFASGIGKVLRTIGGWIRKGMVNYLDIYKDGNCVFSIPITVLIVLFIPFFWFMLALLVVFLFLGCRYEFRGPNCKKDSTANHALNKASEACNSVKEDFKRGYNGEADNNDSGR
ncbi:MAG: DUF4342 domain-containing protein [Lachnospiraceae bacterium]